MTLFVEKKTLYLYREKITYIRLKIYCQKSEKIVEIITEGKNVYEKER